MRPRRLPFPAALALAIALLVTLFGVAILLPPALAPSALDLGGGATTGTTDQAVTAANSPASRASGSTTSAAASKPPAAPKSPATPKSPAAVIPTSQPTAEAGILAWENQVTTLVNAERKKAGCPALRTDERLRQSSRAHSADMVKFNFFSHKGHDDSSFVDRMERAGYPKGSAAAENIAYGYGSPAAVVKGWMSSASHKANLLSCGSKAVGVGLVYKGTTSYWTQNFGRD